LFRSTSSRHREAPSQKWLGVFSFREKFEWRLYFFCFPSVFIFCYNLFGFLAVLLRYADKSAKLKLFSKGLDRKGKKK